MKTAIYIEDGVTQLVLTPETEYEKDIVKGFGDKLSTVRVFHGGFYDCRGGWVRQSAYTEPNDAYPWRRSEECSLVLKVSADSGQNDAN